MGTVRMVPKNWDKVDMGVGVTVDRGSEAEGLWRGKGYVTEEELQGTGPANTAVNLETASVETNWKYRAELAEEELARLKGQGGPTAPGEIRSERTSGNPAVPQEEKTGQGVVGQDGLPLASNAHPVERVQAEGKAESATSGANRKADDGKTRKG